MIYEFETIPQKVNVVRFTGENKQEILEFIGDSYALVDKDGKIIVKAGYDLGIVVDLGDVVVRYSSGFLEVYTQVAFKASFRESAK